MTLQEFITQFVAAFGWSTLAIVVAQLVGIILMWWMGLPPKKLVHEIEDVQNAAVGAVFFIVSVAASLFIGVYFSSGFNLVQSFVNSAIWFTSGLVLAWIYIWIIFVIAHRVMDRIEGESVYRYIRREIVDEQNAALALFLGGLSLPAFVAVVFQII